MPAWRNEIGGPLTDEQIAAVVAYMRSWEPTAPDSARLARPVLQPPGHMTWSGGLARPPDVQLVRCERLRHLEVRPHPFLIVGPDVARPARSGLAPG